MVGTILEIALYLLSHTGENAASTVCWCVSCETHLQEVFVVQRSVLFTDKFVRTSINQLKKTLIQPIIKGSFNWIDC